LNPTNVDASPFDDKGAPVWEPRSEHLIVPTLVLTCGALSSFEITTLKAQVLERAELVLPRGFVHWLAKEPRDDLLLEKIERVLAPFLKLDYIEELQARGLVQNLLDAARDYDLHIVVVHKRGPEDPSQFLRDLGTKIRAAMAGGVRFSLTLIAIGDGLLDLGEDNPFWPCFRLSPTSYGRFAVSDKRILEVCQNLLVALATSELVRAIEWHLGKEKQGIAWIWLGASALVVDIPSMQDYVRLQVLHHLIERMIGDEPSRVELQARDQEVKLCVDRLQGENLVDALSQLQSDWSIHLHTRTHANGRYWTNQLSGEPELQSKDLCHKIVKPDLYLAQTLRNYYLRLRDSLIRYLGPRIRQRYEVLLGRIFALFDPPPDYAKQQAGEWQLKHPPLFGLTTVTHAIEIAAEYLQQSADIVHPGLSYHRIGSDAYLASVASEDAHLAHRNYIRFRRKERTFLSWFGFLVKLIPAWPLLTGLLLLFPQWGVLRWLQIVLPNWPEEWCLAIAAFLLLTFIATIEYYAWQIDLGKWWNSIKRATISEIATTVLQITYKILRDYRMLMVGRLQEIATVLRELVTLLRKVDQEYRLLTAAIEDKIAWQEKRQSSIYWLSDLVTCDRWAKRALCNIDTVQMRIDAVTQTARPIFNIQARAILENILKYGPRFSYSRDPSQVLSHREIYSQIETIAQQAFNIASNEGRWEFYKEQGDEEREAAIARAPVGGLEVVMESAREPRYIRITEDQALQRMVESKPIYVREKKDKYKLVTGREPSNFLRYNELDICVLAEKEELLKEGRRWQWLYQRAIPLGNGAKTQMFNFLTTNHDSVWRVHASGQHNEHWQKLKQQGQEFIILRSVLPNEIGCARIIVEYR
jgi:hypothetical protein